MTRLQKHLAIVLLFSLAMLSGCGRAPKPPPPVEPGICLSSLAARGIAFSAVRVAGRNSACRIENPVELQGAAIAWNQPTVVDCLLAMRMEAFEREAVQAAALKHFGQPVRRLHNFGGYQCRGRSGNSARWSEHAFGKALDIAAFELADGTIVSVKEDWSRRGRRRDFLRDVAARACAYFSVVLSPASDRYHRDHLHVDMGPHRLCSV